MMNLQGKVALITGAGRRDGMGWAAAHALADAGADILVTAYGRKPLTQTLDLGNVAELARENRSAEDASADLRNLCNEIRNKGVNAEYAALDIRSASEAEAAIVLAKSTFGRLDILFNNAGVAFGAGAFQDLTDDQWRGSLEINVLGTANMIKAALPLMIESGGGSIINNASIAGLRALPALPAYNASKFAIIGLTESVAMEFGTAGIRCNAICAGAIQTRLGDLEYDFTAALTGTDRDAAIAGIVAGIPAGRLGTPADVAALVLFLASHSSSYITGAAIPITGGQHLN
jgi:NAD(P)-dependent dehydrogenase (short-subunit alcohol dehydrogenase family)